MASTDTRALEGGDLQQRRKTRAAKNADGRRVDGRPALARVRRRRKDDRKATAGAATLLRAAVALLFVVLVARLLGGSPHRRETSLAAGTSRLLRQWKPKPKGGTRAHLPIPSVAELEAEQSAAQRAERREARHRSLYRPKFDRSVLGYDIHNCPEQPPRGYPMAWPAPEVLGNWNPKDVTTLPPARRDVYQGLCVFDHATQYAAALNYRNAEKPFVMRNDPQVTAVARRWEDDPAFLHRALGDEKEYRAERSPTNLFMWYRLRGDAPEGYSPPPNDEAEMTYGEFLERALARDGAALGDAQLREEAAALREGRLRRAREARAGVRGAGAVAEDEGGDGRRSEAVKDAELFYFRLNADLHGAKKPGTAQRFVYDQLPFFDPRRPESSAFYLVDPAAERGINCRFGMRGVTAANHFDMSRNALAVLGGERRYVLAHPSQCDRMALYPPGHPSVRHSSLDWSDPAAWAARPEFGTARVNEVVLRAGDVLYLPTNWFHFIVNLSLNYQCNARSGITKETKHFIKQCGF